MNTGARLNHIAIIPDGNRRWSKLCGLPALEGHRVGAERMHQVIDNLLQLEVKYLTVWGFSMDNWKRSDEEVESLFNLLELQIAKDTLWLHSKGVRLNHIGRMHDLPHGLQDVINRAMGLTEHNIGMTLNLAFNYTGRAETVDAVRRMIADHVPSENVDEKLLAHYLYTDDMPDVDLVIRTADEFRLSNFMLWQTAYSEFYFTPVFWPDFDKLELEKALKSYHNRVRRFGGD